MRSIALIASAALLSLAAPRAQTPAPTEKPIKVALMCFKTGEQVSGMNKICFYNCAGSDAAITVSAAQLCPLSINR
jgi:hypothetical protein